MTSLTHRRQYPQYKQWIYYFYNCFLFLAEAKIFVNREISFTLHDDIYIRYLCFDNQNELEKELCSRCPFKIDIGAVMDTRYRVLYFETYIFCLCNMTLTVCIIN